MSRARAQAQRLFGAFQAWGADPVEAEHTLPSAADSAYDLARRALWDAERRMKTCG